jgi:polyhydroxyalkanoate synthase subunit PhaC
MPAGNAAAKERTMADTTATGTTTGTAATQGTAATAQPFALLQAWQQTVQQALAQSARTFDVLGSRERAAVGQTAKDVIWSRGTAQLLHYRPIGPRRHALPLLMVHSLVSKPYILDLIPGNSFIEFLVSEGFDVYMVDWGTPRPEDRRLTLESYVLDMIPTCVDVMLCESGQDEFSLFGYCMGGMLALMYAATHTDAPLRNLITLATPVDFREMGLQGLWSQTMDADRLVDALGNVPASMMQNSFRMLKPASEVSPVRFMNLWQNALNDKYIVQYRAFDQWTNDHIPFPGEAFRQTTKEIAQQNRFYQGTLELGGRNASLANIRCSFLAVAAESDHIVQLKATLCQEELVGSSDKEMLVLPGGHVGLAAGRKAKQTLWPKVSGWLAERSLPATAIEQAEAVAGATAQRVPVTA